MNAAIRIVAEYGFEGFTTKKWAAEAGVAEGSLYYHFKSKNDLLDQTFLFIDRDIADICNGLNLKTGGASGLKQSVTEIWWKYYRYLLGNPEKLFYYYRYRTSIRFNADVNRLQEEHYAPVMRMIRELDENYGITEKVEWDILWSYILDSTTALAYRVKKGCLSDGEKAGEQFLWLMMKGFSQFVKSF